jgi:uncharacterized membrane protein YfcA
VAAVAGFGVGSLLTPFLTLAYDGKVAVALVAIPHGIATVVRLWRLRQDIAWEVLREFGVASAIGGLIGAYVFTVVAGDVLTSVLAALLIAVGVAEITGVAPRLRLTGRWAWTAGVVSGAFGGMVGNQGGVRSAGLLAFGLSPRSFVATAAAMALIVDAVRIPLYVWETGAALRQARLLIITATLAVVIGTFAGTAVLLRLDQQQFRRAVGTVLLVLGLWLFR